jgi:L-aspartate oxidase
LISEAVRGEGAHLIDEAGERFAFAYHPAGELAPRDVVSRAIFSHLQKTADPAEGHVYLDLRPIPAERIRHRFPNIIQVCKRWGVDVFTEPVPVAPAAHYWMGGVKVDLLNRTSIPGLYAVGETASTGVHGANRLASNSLLECLVFAAQLRQIDLNASGTLPQSPSTSPILTGPWNNLFKEVDRVKEIRIQLQRLMWQSAGISRSQAVLESAITQVQDWREEINAKETTQVLFCSLPSQNFSLPSDLATESLRLYAECYNLLDVAYLILQSAALRHESRGGHYRSDYPQPRPEWQVHTLVQGENWFSSSS